MENQINSIHWHDDKSSECAGLYQTIPGVGDTWIATIEKVCGTEKPVYLLSMQCETTYYGSHDLHADSMEQAKQVASMLLLKNATAFCDAYKKKIESLSAITSQLNCSVARFTEKDLQFQDIEFNDAYTGLNCQFIDSMTATLEHAFGLPQEDGKWYNFYAAYDYRDGKAYVIYTENTDESCTEVNVSLTKLEEEYVTNALHRYVKTETTTHLYTYIEDAYREHIATSLKNHRDYALLQLPDNSHGFRFSSLSHQKKRNGRIQTVYWETVYTGSLEEGTQANNIHRMLEAIYASFNIKRPETYVGRSMSVSDIVAINVNGTVEFWYCDSIGFTKI